MPVAELEEILRHIGEVLPAQGPIGIFIHHNTLHSFESMDFERAVISAGDRLSCEPFLAEDEYRRAIRRGRIARRDIEWALLDDLGQRGSQAIVAGLGRLELRRRVVTYGIPEAEGVSLSWLLQETTALSDWREDIPDEARRLGKGPVDVLWKACRSAVQKAAPLPPAAASAPPTRHRDGLAAATGLDTDAWVHPVLIRLVGAFMDQGIARWTLPDRSRGLYACFLDLYSHDWASLCGSWTGSLPMLIREERSKNRSATDSLRDSLDDLGVGQEEAGVFLEKTALALRGWAGMVRQLEQRPDRVPARSVPARLADFLAVRLLLERAALSHAARRVPGFDGRLSRLRELLRRSIPRPHEPSIEERAWRIFHLAQLCGLTPAKVDDLPPAQVSSLEAELVEFNGVHRRRILQSAYDRHLRSRLCDALVAHDPVPAKRSPTFQAVFCLDEREESFRRHLEEMAPDAETYSTAGFFGVAMYYQGATDARPRPLCPIVTKPAHYVGETKADPSARSVRWRRLRRHGSGLLGRLVQRFHGTFLGGYVITTLLGPVSLLPLVFRVVFPRPAKRWFTFLPFSRAPATKLSLDRRPESPPLGTHFGYTKEEMADIVREILQGIGIAGRLSPIVVVAGHGSTSLNNPHGSAYDCGACGGGRGGPNARAFAQMANDPAVRGILAREGFEILDDCRFVGAQRNTCDNSVKFFDLESMPAKHRARFDAVAAVFARTRRKEAHERCRRFESFPLSGGHGAALAHVEGRAQDLAQPRPELGHATNAFCVVGRRSRTRGLFLDRRAFLISYDRTRDRHLDILERTLTAAVPVVAGISLEYYFSRVDPAGYGCSSKLPHNVGSLLGVMDGAQSDLRTGLPWQMVEIHEPVRLFIVVECPPDDLESALSRLPDVRRLVDQRWIFAASLDPDSQSLWLREANGYRPWAAEASVAKDAGDSTSWYQGKRDHLPFAEIAPQVRPW